MSITGNLNVFPFSLTGLQNINGTINGETPCTAITVVGSQATYLQASPVDVNGNINLTPSIPLANTSTTGLLTNTDWNTFNSKAASFTTYAPIDYSANVISIGKASTSTNGYLSSTDFSTFNNKQNSVSSYAPVDFSNSIISMSKANATTNGYLSSGDWVAFSSSSAGLLASNNTWTGWNQYNGDVSLNGTNTYFSALTDFYTYVNNPNNLSYITKTSNNKTYSLTNQAQNYLSHIPIDISNANYTFDTTAKISNMSNGFIYTSQGMTANRTITLPTSGAVAAYYGKAFSGVLYIQRPNQAGTYNLLLDRTSVDSGTKVSLNGVVQSSFPISLYYNTSYTITISLVSLLTPTSGLWNLYYDIQANGSGSIPAIADVLDAGSIAPTQSMTLTNGNLLANGVYSNFLGSILNPSVSVVNNLDMSGGKYINYGGEVDIRRQLTKILDTSGSNVNLLSSNLYLTSLPNWSAINDQNNINRLCQTTNGKAYYLDRLNFNKQLHYNIDISNTDYTFGTIPSTTANIIENCMIFSSTSLTANRTITLPLFDTFGYAYNTSNYQFQFNINQANSNTYGFLITLYGGGDSKTKLYYNGTLITSYPLTLLNKAYTIVCNIISSPTNTLNYNIMDNRGLIPLTNTFTGINSFTNNFTVVNNGNTTLNLTNTICDLRPARNTPIQIDSIGNLTSAQTEQIQMKVGNDSFLINPYSLFTLPSLNNATTNPNFASCILSGVANGSSTWNPALEIKLSNNSSESTLYKGGEIDYGYLGSGNTFSINNGATTGNDFNITNQVYANQSQILVQTTNMTLSSTDGTSTSSINITPSNISMNGNTITGTAYQELSKTIATTASGGSGVQTVAGTTQTLVVGGKNRCYIYRPSANTRINLPSASSAGLQIGDWFSITNVATATFTITIFNGSAGSQVGLCNAGTYGNANKFALMYNVNTLGWYQIA